MTELRGWMLSYFINSLWIVPFVILAGTQMSRRLMGRHPILHHRFVVATLIAAVLAPAAPLRNVEHLLQASIRTGSPSNAGFASTSHVAGKTDMWHRFSHRSDAVRVTPSLGNVVWFAYALLLLWRSIRLVFSIKTTGTLLSKSEPVQLPKNVLVPLEALTARFGIRELQIRQSNSVASPMIAGCATSVLLVPISFFSGTPEQQIEVALAHEFAHASRKDFSLNIAYQMLMLPIAYHPAVKLLQNQLHETREIACDELAANVLGSRHDYAHSLLQLAKSLAAPVRRPVSVSLGIFESDNLEKRVMTLMAKRRTPSPALKRAAETLLVCVMVAIFVTASALTIQVSGEPVPAYKQFIGTWQARFHGKSFVTVQLLENNGGLTGTIGNGRIETDSDGNLTSAEELPGTNPISKMNASGNELRILGKDTDGSDIEFNMKMLSPDLAEMQLIVPPEMKIKPWRVYRIR